MSGVCPHGVLLHQHCRECAAPEHAAQIRGVERLREAKLRGAHIDPAQVEALQQRFIDYQRDERGRTVSEVVYWRQQYKQLAADALAALRPQAAPAEQPDMLLFEHEDGRYAVAQAGAAFLVGEPAWHRLGPVTVHAPLPQPEAATPEQSSAVGAAEPVPAPVQPDTLSQQLQPEATLQAILRCRYPVDTRIRPDGFDWDIPRLNDVIATLTPKAST